MRQIPEKSPPADKNEPWKQLFLTASSKSVEFSEFAGFSAIYRLENITIYRLENIKPWGLSWVFANSFQLRAACNRGWIKKRKKKNKTAGGVGGGWTMSKVGREMYRGDLIIS